MPAGLRGLIEGAHLRLLFQAVGLGIVGMIKDQALGHVLLGPGNQIGANGAAVFQTAADWSRGSSTGLPIHQPRPVAAFSASCP